MEYQEVLAKIFDNRGPKSLRTLFDAHSNEWQDTTMVQKSSYLNQMLQKHPIEYWIEQYKLQYQTTHPHIISSIDQSLAILKIRSTTSQIDIETKADLVVARCMKEVSFDKDLDNEYKYSSLALCVIDSVFSIGVRYEGVKNVIRNVSTKLGISAIIQIADGSHDNEIETSDFLSKISHLTVEAMATDLYKNMQRTSTSKGILKAEAALSFIRILIKYKVEKFTDIPKVFNDREFEHEVKSIKGQSSGISLKYFYMLAGNGDMIKPDRMIMNFLQETLGKAVSMNDAQDILYLAAKKLSKLLDEPINAMTLDNCIWKYQRQLPSKTLQPLKYS
jgi:hypothetical protein